jgi:signal transduction histidine kinase
MRVLLVENNPDDALIIQEMLSATAIESITIKTKFVSLLYPIQADFRRLEQFLGNPISNAIKFTSARGAIEVGAQALDPGSVEVWVKDNGEGIAAQEIGQIFQKYRHRRDAAPHLHSPCRRRADPAKASMPNMPSLRPKVK